MKGRRQRQQTLADEIEEEPGKNEARQQLDAPENTGKAGPLQKGNFDKFAQTGRANHLVVVLRNAFPAKVLGAPGTTRHGFALGMVEAALKSERRTHGIIRGGAFGSSTTWRGPAAAAGEPAAVAKKPRINSGMSSGGSWP